MRTPFILFIFCLLPFFSKATAPKAPTHLRTCDKVNPVGTDNRPYFGWYVNDADPNEIQTAWQIQVSQSITTLASGKGMFWDSGKTLSRMQNYLSYPGKPLAPGTRYYWRVRTWDKTGLPGPWSASGQFDTGEFTSADWAGAKWVKRDTNDGDDYTYYRKTAVLPAKKVKRAIVYVSAGHSFEFFAGGKRIGKGASFHYPQYAYYQAFDITSSVKPGKNVFAALTHWYGGGQGRAPGSRGFLAKVVIDFSDGSHQVIGTDASWKQKQADSWVMGQRQRGGEGIGYVEKIDARKFNASWNTLACNDSAWDSAVEIGAPPVSPWTGDLQADLTRAIEDEIKPVSIKNTGAGKYIIDLGKVYAGMPKIVFTGGKAGDMVSMHGAYVLNEDGTVNQRGNQGTNLDYFFILNGGTATFQPLMYYGYRYLVVENVPNILTAASVSFVTTHYELDAGREKFLSSNPMLNEVWNLMARSLIQGTHEDFLDTPTREKGSFLGDAGYQGPPSMMVFGDRTMNLRILLEFLDSQDQYWPDGRLNAVYPNSDGKRDIPDYTQAFLVWIWDYYQQTGNKSFLADNYLKFKKIADYVYTYRNASTGLINKLAGGGGGYIYGIIDWPSPMRYGYDMSPDSRTVIDVYAYIDFDIVSKIAAELGNTGDQQVYREKATAMKEAINTHLINQQGVYADGLKADLTQSAHVSQHANMFPLAAGIVPEKNRQSVIDAVKERKMSVGMVSVRMLPEALGITEQGEHLLELYTNPAWDGWARTVALGGTMTWEDWNANTNGNSMSHPWGAIGLLGIQQYILGVKTLKPQHELVQIKPLSFGGKLSSASGVCPTDHGDIHVTWADKGAGYMLTVTLPVNSAAEVFIPKSAAGGSVLKMDGKMVNGKDAGNYLLVSNVGSGTHTFVRQ